MKKAAGVSDIDEVVRRFETQEETAKHLQELQVVAKSMGEGLLMPPSHPSLLCRAH
jgi:hypothetical protein